MLGTWVSCLLLSFAVPVPGGGQVTIAAVSGRAGAAIPTGAGRAGRSGCAWEKDGAELGWALAELCAACPKSHHWTAAETMPLQTPRHSKINKQKKGTITLNYFCYFYPLKAGFWGYEWNLCTQYFRLAGKKNYKCCTHLRVG